MQNDRALARWRESKAIELRLEGLNYEGIARALGYGSRASAWKAVDRALNRQTAANAEEYRSKVLVDAYILQESAWKAACEGKSGGIYQALRALDMRAKVLGLYQRPNESLG